jgi:hypothetical protein
MTTPEIRESEKKGFIRLQKSEQGGVVPSKLNQGDIILVETEAFMYELQINTLSYPTMRMTVNTASKVVKDCGDHIISIDSLYRKLKLTLKDWIGLGMCMKLKFTSGTSVLTGPVLGATLTGMREDFTEFQYDLWT